MKNVQKKTDIMYKRKKLKEVRPKYTYKIKSFKSTNYYNNMNIALIGSIKYEGVRDIRDFIFKINVQNSDFFYVLIHPADFLDSNDLKHIEGSHSLERIDKDYGLKNQRFIERLELLIKSGFTFTTFDTLITDN